MTNCLIRTLSASDQIPLGIHSESTRNPPRIHPEFGRILVGLGSRWIRVILLGLVGIWWEFGGNDSQSRSNLGGFSLILYSYQIPTIPTKFHPIRPESTRIRVECVGECQVLAL